jgi:chorismate mutase
MTKRLTNAKRKGGWLRRLVRPFKRENTKLWRDRERIRNVLRRIRDNADEAWLCLEKAEREEHDISQASTALGELETAINELKP